MASSVEQQRESGGNSRRRQWRCDQRRVNLPTVKRKLLLIFAVVMPLGLFLAARQAASWRPQRISAAEFNSRLVPVPSYRGEGNNAPIWWQRLEKVARSKGWELEAVSPDQRRMLVSASAPNFCYHAAVLDSKGAVVARLPSRPAKAFCGEWDGSQFSPNGTLVSFSQFEVSATQVFDARTGQHLWSGEQSGEAVYFSPDGRFAALKRKGDLWLLDARNGAGLRKLQVPAPYDLRDWGFSSDGYSYVAKSFDTPASRPANKTSTARFWKWRLR